MKKVSLSGSLRESVGKKSTKKLRKEEKVPCVIYGKGEQIQFSVPEKEVGKLVWSPNVYNFIIDIDGKEHSAVIQDLQFHPVSDRLLHVDFFEITEDKPFKVALPVEPVGAAPGVVKGGKLTINRRKLNVKGLIKDLPETIKIDITGLDVADTLKVSELAAESDLTFLDPASDVVVAVKSSRKMVDVEEENAEE